MKVVAPEVEQSSRLIGGDEQAKAVEEEEAGAATLTFWFGMLLVVSVTMTVGNKVSGVDKHPHYSGSVLNSLRPPAFLHRRL
jgi:hypothetical protein